MLLVLPAVAIFVPHSSQRASLSFSLVKYLQRRLLLRRLAGGMVPDRTVEIGGPEEHEGILEVEEVVEVEIKDAVPGTQEVEAISL